jgi:hypothetical protein
VFLPCQSTDGRHCGPTLTTKSGTGTRAAERKRASATDRGKIRTIFSVLLLWMSLADWSTNVRISRHE